MNMAHPWLLRRTISGTWWLLLLAATGLVIYDARFWGSHRQVNRQQSNQQIQEMLGGLGGGPALDLAEDARAFDPRLSPAPTEDFGPLLDGSRYGGLHIQILDDAEPP